MASLEEQIAGALVTAITTAVTGVVAGVKVERERDADIDLEELGTTAHVNVCPEPAVRVEPKQLGSERYHLALKVELTVGATDQATAFAAVDALRDAVTSALYGNTLGGLVWDLVDAEGGNEQVVPRALGVGPVLQRIVNFDVQFFTAEGQPSVAV